MARKLGYMWYPKDWTYSDSVFELRIHERGVYRELIDMAMMQDNIVIIKKITWCRKWYIKVNELDDILEHLSSLDLVIIDGDKLSVPSCETRLYAKRNGSKGGKSTADGTANSTADDTPKENININTNKTIKKKVFEKPTQTQVSEYFKQRKSTDDSERFIDFYTSKGWMIGKNKMKDWKAAVRNWSRDKQNKNSSGYGNGKTTY